MKKILVPLFTVCILLSFGIQANAVERPTEVYIDGVKIKFGMNPVLQKGTTYVQFRPIFEALGYRVTWEPILNGVIAEKDGRRIRMNLNDEYVILDYEIKKISSPPIMKYGYTLVPIRLISEYSGKDVKWDPSSKSIHITSKEEQVKKGCKDLIECIESGQENGLEQLLTDGNTTISMADFEQALNSKNEKAIGLFLERGYDLKTLALSTQSKWFTIAVENRSYKIMELLIDGGISPDISFNMLSQPTALVYAVRNNDLELVDFLLKKGADPLKKESPLLNDYSTAVDLAYKLGYTNIYDSLMNSARSIQTIPNGLSINSSNELREHVKKYYGKLSTNLGIIAFNYAVEENTSKTYAYDYKVTYRGNVFIDESFGIKTNSMSIEDLLQDVRFTSIQKENFVRDLRNFTEKNAKELSSLMPGKKITGGFYRFTSFVPDGIPRELRGLAGEVFGSSSNQFLTWTNYSPDNAYYYHETKISDFHWFGYYDNANLTTDVPLRSISIPTRNFEVNVGESFSIPYSTLPQEATNVELEWTVYNPDILSIDSTGTVTGLKKGLASIKVYSKQDPRISEFTLVWVKDIP
ncbi:stalk domain-containing protein [Paenibacillus silvae]|uniref:stalk domain-containing protein n=1 Tax=Paenibacillus silvae TaxID=1325358 RepID=UPI002004E671|nr:stalk domain-containing protein [Paenibacillus silvae]MCK6078128.1 Ig-like domain-containing protein [Paenibacillus silvae]MCK6152470.1 Ig-like domain-containing protein [Paenibacillus silvae]MCK6271011.1 Ig-like domain-containing protein [Paenibacillus silvae]